MFGIIAGLGIILTPLTFDANLEGGTSLTLPTNSDRKSGNNKKELSEMNGLLIDLEGKMEISGDKSKLIFELDSKGGRTKGAIKEIEGTFNFENEISINVTMAVNSLTTFNSYRDESLMEEGYFNSKKFPSISFVSTSVTGNEGNLYTVKGMTKMLGVEMAQEFSLKYLGEN